jgi:hypothetical protein
MKQIAITSFYPVILEAVIQRFVHGDDARNPYLCWILLNSTFLSETPSVAPFDVSHGMRRLSRSIGILTTGIRLQ